MIIESEKQVGQVKVLVRIAAPDSVAEYLAIAQGLEKAYSKGGQMLIDEITEGIAAGYETGIGMIGIRYQCHAATMFHALPLQHREGIYMKMLAAAMNDVAQDEMTLILEMRKNPALADEFLAKCKMKQNEDSDEDSVEP